MMGYTSVYDMKVVILRAETSVSFSPRGMRKIKNRTWPSQYFKKLTNLSHNWRGERG